MCGILGGTKKDWNIEKALQSLYHRGPDSQKHVHHYDLSLGFCRLAIIDLSQEADQPMSTEDKQLWIVFNGEIYGFKKLRHNLEGRGHKFHTQSDTEVILHAYREWGNNFVDHIDGMFAIAIHDQRTKELKLFRDRVGIKPLFYYYDGKHFAFSSELKGIVKLCHDANFQHDTTALYDFLTYHYIPEPKTLYKNVFKLPPAHQLIFDLQENKIREIKQYWELKVEPKHNIKTNIQSICEELRNLIRESIKDQLVSDVPIGCFLSGGMDSSTIVAEASLLKDNLETYSIGFEDEKYTETNYADLVAKKFNTKHHTKILSNIRTNELFKKLRDWYDEPFGDTSAFPTYLVSEFAREKLTVVLTGDGGDEIFGGYPRFNTYRFLCQFPRIKILTLKKISSFLRFQTTPASLLNKFFYAMEILTSGDIEGYSVVMGELPAWDQTFYREKWNIPNEYDAYWYYRKHYRKNLPMLTRLQYLDFHTYLPSDILTKIDRTSMAVSLEARVPFLSRKVIEFIFSVPEEIRFYKNQQKGLLKEAYKEILPKEIIARSKMGFGIPTRYFTQNYEEIQKKIINELYG